MLSIKKKKDIGRLKVKKYIFVSINQRKAGLTILQSDKADFRV